VRGCLTKRLWNHAIEMKEEFMPRKGKMYLLLREKRREVHRLIKEQLRKGYIKTLKVASNSTSVFCREEGW